MDVVWLVLVILGVLTATNAQKSCDDRIRLEQSDSEIARYELTFKKSDGKWGRKFIVAFSSPLISISSGEAMFVKKKWKRAYELKINRHLSRMNIMKVRIQIKYRRDKPTPTLTRLRFRKFFCSKNTMVTCKNNKTIANTDCNSYLKPTRRENPGAEDGGLHLPVPNRLSSWKLVIGFDNEMQNFHLQAPRLESKECGRIFSYRNNENRKNLRAGQPLKLRYNMHYSRDYAERPKVTYIFFGNEICNQTCGVKPVCPPPTTPQPETTAETTTEVTTEAPPVVVTTEAPPVVVTTEGPPEVVTTEGPPEVVTTEGPPEVVTTEGPPEIVTTEGPPEVVTTEGPPEVVTTEGPPEVVTTEGPPEVVTTEGPPEVVTTEGPPEVVTTEGPPEVVTTEGPPEVVTTEAPPPADFKNKKRHFHYKEISNKQ